VTPLQARHSPVIYPLHTHPLPAIYPLHTRPLPATGLSSVREPPTVERHCTRTGPRRSLARAIC